jgi:aminopeptidase-like protein
VIEEIDRYFERLWPILRSITGPGVRATHDILGELLPLERLEFPTGEKVLDWTIPREWVARQAYVVGPDGRRVIDLARHTLHLLNYSAPFRGRMSRADLDKHLYSLPEMPNAIPYVTSYYAERWGFCLSDAERRALPEGEYEVVVDTELVDGSLTVSHCVLPGQTSREVLISTYTCHPSMANNELSGPLVTAFLYRRLAALPNRRYTYRFVFLPETIGSIAYLSRFGSHLAAHVDAGYVVTCIGDPGHFHYKASRRGNTVADRAARLVLGRIDPEAVFLDFFPHSGADERQYCSPGFNLPVGSIMRTPYARYPQYHTSLDDRSFVTPEALAGSVDAYEAVCRVLEGNKTYENLSPHGEPQLGRRGLYPTVGAARTSAAFVDAMLWVLNSSDGTNDLISVAERSGLEFDVVREAATAAEAAGLLRET